MNIFVLDSHPKKCARYHCDKHVVKMVVEYAQILASAHHFCGSQWVNEVYRQTHQNTPCPLWVVKSSANYLWLYELFTHLCTEYTYRYGRVHLTDQKMRGVLLNVPTCLPIGGITAHPLVMPEEYKTDCEVESYRNFYREDKIRFAKWTKRPIPEWMND